MKYFHYIQSDNNFASRNSFKKRKKVFLYIYIFEKDNSLELNQKDKLSSAGTRDRNETITGPSQA